VDVSEELIQECRHEFKLKCFFANNKVLALFVDYVQLWKDLAFYLTLLINIFIFFSYQ